MQWGKFSFTRENNAIRTDLALYRDRSHLLLPAESEENRFLVSADEYSIQFFIGSTSLESFSTLEKFFTRMYKCYIMPDSPENLKPTHNIALSNRRIFRKKQLSYFPGFLKNMINLPSSIPDLKMEYEVIIRSDTSIFRAPRYNFLSLVRLEYTGSNPDRISDFLKNEVRRMKEEGNWKLKIKSRNLVKFKGNLLRDPTGLYNFVRVPEDEGR